jgi:deoxycytidylate deaminase
MKNSLQTEEMLKIARAVAEGSPDEDTKVGAVIGAHHSSDIVSVGFNKFARGCSNDLPTARPGKYEYINALHAEKVAIINAARTGKATDGCAMYCTLSPCKDCLRTCWEAGIAYIMFQDWHSSVSKEIYEDMKDMYVKVDEWKSGCTTLALRPSHEKPENIQRFWDSKK